MLLGLAVWASEFEWANQLMGRFKRGCDGTDPEPPRKIAFALFFGCCALVGCGYLLLLGIPPWRGPAGIAPPAPPGV